MVAPRTWNAPTSGGTIGSSWPSHAVWHAGDYWVSAVPTAGSASAPTLRYATDPTGAWGSATIPAAPTGYEYTQQVYGPLQFDGTNYALVARYGKVSGYPFKSRILHTTDPTGTWTAYEYDATDAYTAYSIAYADGTWVIAGRRWSGGTFPAFVGTSSTVNGTYAFSAGSAATGYDETVLGDQLIDSIAYGNGQWMSVGQGSPDMLRTSASPTSGWTTPSLTITGTLSDLRYNDNGYWSVIDDDETVRFTTDPTGAWSSVGTATVGLTDIRDIAHGSGYWVAVGGNMDGGYRAPRIAYCRGDAPTGTWTVLSDTGFAIPAATNVRVFGVAHSAGVFVAGGQVNSEIRWARASAESTLRQRQSPRRSPSRVGYPALRQRQSPFIR